MKPEELSRELRHGTGGFLRRRRQVAALLLRAMVPMGVVALYQLGIIDHVPEPPLPGLDGDQVDAAPEAYAMLSTPDAVLGLASYAVTLGLAAMGGEDRANEKLWIPLALAAKVAFDAFEAGKLNTEGWRKHGAFCFWCLLSAGSTFATAPLVIPETRGALRRLLDGGTRRWCATGPSEGRVENRFRRAREPHGPGTALARRRLPLAGAFSQLAATP